MESRKASDALLARARRQAGVEVVPGGPGHEGLRALTALLYPALDIREAEYQRWQYGDNPAGPAVIRLATHGGATVGQYAVIPQDFRVRGRDVKGSLSLNTMTHPDHRAKGIFMILAEEVYAACRESGLAFTLGFPNPNSHAGFIRKLGFADLGELPLWIRPLRLAPLAAHARVPGAALAGLAQPLWDALGLLWRGGDEGFAVEETDTIGPDFGHLWEQGRDDYAALTARTPAYLSWRYLRHPTRRYRVWTARKDGVLRAWLVSRVTEVDGVRSGMLVDLFARAGTEGEAAARALVRRASASCAEEGASLLGCLMAPGTPGARALAAAGFLRCPKRFLPQPFPVIYRPHGAQGEGPQASALSEWYLTMGDYDAV